MKRSGYKQPRQRKVPVCVTMTPEMIKQVDTLAFSRDLTRSQLFRQLIVRELSASVPA